MGSLPVHMPAKLPSALARLASSSEQSGDSNTDEIPSENNTSERRNVNLYGGLLSKNQDTVKIDNRRILATVMSVDLSEMGLRKVPMEIKRFRQSTVGI